MANQNFGDVHFDNGVQVEEILMARLQVYPRLALVVLGLSLLAAPPATAQELIDCPTPIGTPGSPHPTMSRQMFSDVCFLNPDPFGPFPAPVLFDDFAWRSFLALVWPAQQDQRGRPDGSLGLDAPQRPTVFETFKSEWEVFQKDGRDPTGWNDYGGTLPCDVPADLRFGDMILASFAKFDSILQANFVAFSGALVSQNGKYVRYSSGFNETLFQHIADGKLFIAQNLHDHFTPFPAGSIRVKAAWIDMEGIDKPERFHTRQAWLLDRATNRCEQKQVGLVGLHIVVKTPSIPQWVWATFEHVDNVPGPHARKPYTFNNGDGAPMPDKNPIACDPGHPCPTAPAAPYNVERVHPILGEPPADMNFEFSTADTNIKYRTMLAHAYPNSPWQNYQLVMTQWPTNPNRQDLDGAIENTFPGTHEIPGAGPTASANSTIETFLQKSVSTGCMACHLVAKSYDYVSSLLTRPYVPDPSALPDAHVEALNKMMNMFDAHRQK
jgi:hypothetical protein